MTPTADKITFSRQGSPHRQRWYVARNGILTWTTVSKELDLWVHRDSDHTILGFGTTRLTAVHDSAQKVLDIRNES